jgi:hypothetical protein
VARARSEPVARYLEALGRSQAEDLAVDQMGEGGDEVGVVAPASRRPRPSANRARLLDGA